ncbi:ADP-ribose pyrophosphatase YjhB (NUDIX family) [Spinactinospora alkalitolerans]|uniref:ADP-ribose pyrophosphatase YjhB (NUDIX family) n=1 Tax=Spinactinospora alkalitolerans TaxID=687207 RepID=A0A852U925_9ACTN|nr:NUDIX hydrolase [Spinactinospora alkalitolerans]NYE50440.1 ADP-ribose pyrophosphatase YjhB (NUDIX family) [Spinactinospora alkalitolerans]
MLITGPDGRVLLVRSSDRPRRWTLPADRLVSGETPRQTAIRGVGDRIGLIPRLGDLLVSDWTTDRGGPHAGALYIFDGGRISSAAARRIGVPGQNSSAALFTAVDELPAYAAPADVRRIDAALRARGEGRTAHLEYGRTPSTLAAMRRFGIVPGVHSGGAAWSWHEEPVPDELPIRHAWAWVFAPDGRVVVYVDDNGLIGLPGGTLEDFEHRNPAAASVREVREETQIEIADPIYLGYLHDDQPGGKAVARVRMAAAIAAIGPAAPDPATGTVHRRLLVPPRLLAELCGWGRGADRQTKAAIGTARALGITEPDPAAPVAEIPTDGTGIL